MFKAGVELRQGLQHLAKTPAIKDHVMGLGAEAVVVVGEFDQEEVEQRRALPLIRPRHVRLHQGLAGGLRVGQCG